MDIQKAFIARRIHHSMPRKAPIPIPIPLPQRKQAWHQKLIQTIQQGIQQEYLTNKATQHAESSRIFLQQKKLSRAQHQVAHAVLAYYKLPKHDESLHLQLKSLLKKLEREELQPHWHFHHTSHNLLKLKAEKKELSQESLAAIQDFTQALASHPYLAIPAIQKLHQE